MVQWYITILFFSAMYISVQKYRIVNRVLTCLVVVFGLYLGMAPMLPELSFRFDHSTKFSWLRHLLGKQQPSGHGLVTPRTSMAASLEVSTVVIPIPKDNTLAIPDIGVFAPIVEGSSSEALQHGIWHRPKTGTPPTGGNTVLVGHRFLYTSGTNTLYHLDKLKVGNTIEVFWSGQRYAYVVDAILVTLPTAVEIEQPTSQPTLTIYTCTPLFAVDKRLVVRAHLSE